MKKITSKELEILKGKCPKCYGFGRFTLKGYPRKNGIIKCDKCLGKGQGSIEIEKEWVKCSQCYGQGIHPHPHNINIEIECTQCNGKGKIPKYQVGDEIKVDTDFTKVDTWMVKLKIISEKENKQRVIMVK